MFGMEEEENPEEVSEAAGLLLTDRQRQAEARWAMQEREEAVQGLRPIPFANCVFELDQPKL
jgi:hypothetical protein